MGRSGNINIVKKMLCCGANNLPTEAEVVSDGYVRLCVGKNEDILCKFEVDAHYLQHPLFKNLLRVSTEEFGYSYDGPLKIFCDIDLFQYMIHLLKSGNPSAHYMEFSDLVSMFRTSNSNTSRALLQ